MHRSSDGWEPIGTHTIRFEAPDIVFCRPVGEVSGNDVRAILDFTANAAERIGRGIFYLGDSSRITGYGISTTLGVVTAWKLMHHLRATALFGGDFQQRAKNGIVLRAARRLKLPVAQLPIQAFPDEASARAWIDELRSKG